MTLFDGAADTEAAVYEVDEWEFEALGFMVTGDEPFPGWLEVPAVKTVNKGLAAVLADDEGCKFESVVPSAASLMLPLVCRRNIGYAWGQYIFPGSSTAEEMSHAVSYLWNRIQPGKSLADSLVETEAFFRSEGIRIVNEDSINSYLSYWMLELVCKTIAAGWLILDPLHAPDSAHV